MGALSGLSGLSASSGMLPLTEATDPIPLGEWNPIPGGFRDYRLLNNQVEWTMDFGGTTTIFMTDVMEAFICTPESTIYAKLLSGIYISKSDGSSTLIQEEPNDYLYRKAYPDSIPLL